MFRNRSDTNQTVLVSQEMARGMKFRIMDVDGLHYLCSEIKGADQLPNCAFVCIYAKSRFSYEFAHLNEDDNQKLVTLTIS